MTVPKRNIYQRMNAVMQSVDYIQKVKKPGMRYSIVSHDDVTAKVRPELVQHGVIYYPAAMQLKQNGNRTEVQMVVRFQNIDDPADYMTVETAGYGIDDQDKGPGKAISYAVKYALLKALGLESGDDPDEDQHTPHVPEALPLEKKFRSDIEVATTSAELQAADVAIREHYGTGALSPALTQTLRSLIRKKVEALKAPA